MEAVLVTQPAIASRTVRMWSVKLRVITALIAPPSGYSRWYLDVRCDFLLPSVGTLIIYLPSQFQKWKRTKDHMPKQADAQPVVLSIFPFQAHREYILSTSGCPVGCVAVSMQTTSHVQNKTQVKRLVCSGGLCHQMYWTVPVQLKTAFQLADSSNKVAASIMTPLFFGIPNMKTPWKQCV